LPAYQSLNQENTLKNRLYSIAVALTLGAVCAFPAHSQVKPETLVKQRQSAMTLQGKYFYPIRAMAQGKAQYDASVVTRNVGYLDALSRMPWDGFLPSTKDVKTGAMPAVFTETAKFKESQDRFQAEFTKLSDLVKKGGDEPSIRQQIMAVDKSCASCHDNFREKQ
jgi:cytochrome c556